MTAPEFDIIGLIADDKKKISYRPAMVKSTGGVLSAILLSEIVFWYDKMGRVPFYKFTSPVSWQEGENGERSRHPDYKDGDSWCEALGFGIKEFTTARKKIAAKIRKGQPLPGDALVWFWTDTSRRTWYRLNEELFRKCLIGIYVTLKVADTKLPDRDIDKDFSSFTTNHHDNVVVADAGASKNQNPLPGNGIQWPADLEPNVVALRKILNKAAEEKKIDPGLWQQFINELAWRQAAGKIKTTVAGYATGMLDNDWQPDPEAQQEAATGALAALMADLKKQWEAGAHLMIDGQVVTPDPWPHVRLSDGLMSIAQIIKEGVKIEAIKEAA